MSRLEMPNARSGPGASDSKRAPVKLAHVFVENVRGEKKHLLYVGRLGSGGQSQVQLVHDLHQHQLAIRKVLHRRLAPEAVAHLGADPECEMVQYVFKMAADKKQNPKICRLLHACDTEAEKGKLTRASYWQLCNGGSMEAFIGKFKLQDNRHMPFPQSIIPRCILHVLQSLQFLQNLPKPIVFGDMFIGNFLLHFPTQGSWLPDFYLADFGRSYYITEESEESDFIKDLKHLQIEIQEGFPATAPIGPRTSYDPSSRLYYKLSDLVDAFEANPKRRFPDLTAVIELARELADQTMLGIRAWQAKGRTVKSMTQFDEITKLGKSPAVYDTADQALASKGVHGPWYIGKVSMGDTYELVEVDMALSHHRPNVENSRTRTDSPSDVSSSDRDSSGREDEQDTELTLPGCSESIPTA